MNGPKVVGIILVNLSTSSTWNQDTYQEFLKDLNKIIETKCDFIM